MRLLFLFLSNIASFGSAFGISLFVDLNSTSRATSLYFLLLSFISPLSSIKTNATYILKLKGYRGSFKVIRYSEYVLLFGICVYFSITESNFLYAALLTFICYVCSKSLSNITTQLSLISSLRNDLVGPLKTIEANLFRVSFFIFSLIILNKISSFANTEINAPIFSLGISSIGLYLFQEVRLKSIRIDEIKGIRTDLNSNLFNHTTVLNQLIIAINLAFWSSLDRWILGATNIDAETFKTTAWSQTIAIAVASICFSSLFKYIKIKSHVQIFRTYLGKTSFFILSMGIILVLSLILSEISSIFPYLQKFTTIENKNLLSITLISLFVQRVGIYHLYQEKSLQWNILQTISMMIAIACSGIGFYLILNKSIYWAESFIMGCSIVWLFFIITSYKIKHKIEVIN